MPAITCRPAALDDASEIFELLIGVADELSLLLDTLEREEALYAQIRNCARSGESWVAIDEAGHIVGVVLAEPNQLGRHYAEHEIIELRHAAVAPGHRNEGIFGRLMARLLARMVPVATTVARQNRSGIAAHLAKLGFRPTGAPGGEQRLRWEPGAPG